tara:strand:- start:12488 stop:13627 length:1140 start_codon:yes stop_codon:yes gene_type:complete
MKNIFYWSPHIDRVATVRAVINSAYSLVRYSKREYIPYLINVAGEWDQYQDELSEKKINIINLTSSKILQKKVFKGFLKSRAIYFYIFIISFLPLLRLLKDKKTDYLIAHLITPLPLIINFFFKNQTKLILRISGLPKLQNLRLFIWKLTLKKIYLITCPTLGTKDYLMSLNLVKTNKICLLYDPAISPEQIRKTKKEFNINIHYDNYYLAVGRLTKQKNFSFLINSFSKFNLNKDNKLIIVGEGEERKKLEKIIEEKKLNNFVKLIGYQNNVFSFLERSKCFILSSLWEDPGFVLLEAGFSNTFVISSDCKNGPKEILNFGENGFLFKSNNETSLIEALENFENLNDNKKLKYKIKLKKKIKDFSLLNHYNKLINFLD